MKQDEMVELVARMGEITQKFFVGIPRRIWEHNIKMDLKEIGCDDVERIQLAQDTE
jgi:hypothetical protein